MKQILEDEVVKDLSEALNMLRSVQELVRKHFHGEFGSLSLGKSIGWLANCRASRIAELVDALDVNCAPQAQGTHHSEEEPADTSQVAETEHAPESNEDGFFAVFQTGMVVRRKGDALPMRIVETGGANRYRCEWTTPTGGKFALWFWGSDLELLPLLHG